MTEAPAVYYVVDDTIAVSVGGRDVLQIKTGPPPSGATLPRSLPRFSQRDQQWGADTMAGTAQTIAAWGCALTCAAMVAARVNLTITPGRLNQILGTAGFNILKGEAHLAWERLPEHVPGLVWRGRQSWARRLTSAELRAVLTRLEAGPLILWVDYHPQTVPLDTHFVVGLRPVNGGRDILIADPIDGAETRLLLRYGLPGHDLARGIWGYRDLRAEMNDGG